MRGGKDKRTVTCFGCRHFSNNPGQIEMSIPGLNTLSSAYGSVRGEAGICRRFDILLAPRGVRCGCFERRLPEKGAAGQEL
ncbi:MAG: hypothetical protein M0Z75_16565 [Nitrospiraceae bacterium]|nr:hypothetical protein [Nitrospiraceae bacterium]